MSSLTIMHAAVSSLNFALKLKPSFAKKSFALGKSLTGRLTNIVLAAAVVLAFMVSFITLVLLFFELVFSPVSERRRAPPTIGNEREQRRRETLGLNGQYRRADSDDYQTSRRQRRQLGANPKDARQNQTKSAEKLTESDEAKQKDRHPELLGDRFKRRYQLKYPAEKKQQSE